MHDVWCMLIRGKAAATRRMNRASCLARCLLHARHMLRIVHNICPCHPACCMLHVACCVLHVAHRRMWANRMQYMLSVAAEREPLRPPTEREGGARARSRRSRPRAVVRAAAARLRCARRPHVQRVRLTSCTTAAAARRTARRATRGTARTGHRCRETVGARGTAPRTTLWLGVMLLPWRCLARAPPGGMFLLACHVACANGGTANAMITFWTAARCSLRACARALGAAIPSARSATARHRPLSTPECSGMGMNGSYTTAAQRYTRCCAHVRTTLVSSGRRCAH